MGDRKNAKAAAGTTGPAGDPVSVGSARRASRSAAYRAEAQRLKPYEALARIVIRHRLEQGLTQKQVAERVGTSHSAISRIESGQHATSIETMRRLAAALGLRFVVGFETQTAEPEPERELIPV